MREKKEKTETKAAVRKAMAGPPVRAKAKPDSGPARGPGEEAAKKEAAVSADPYAERLAGAMRSLAAMREYLAWFESRGLAEAKDEIVKARFYLEAMHKKGATKELYAALVKHETAFFGIFGPLFGLGERSGKESEK